MGLQYPTPERSTEYNALVVTLIPAKKKDRASVLNSPALFDIIARCKKMLGDVYERAAMLLMELTRRHPFANANRRTAFLAATDFLLQERTPHGCS